MGFPVAALIPLVTEIIKSKGEKKKAAKEKLVAEAVSVIHQTVTKAPVTTGIGTAGVVVGLNIDPALVASYFPGHPDWVYLAACGSIYVLSGLFLLAGKKAEK